MDKYRGKKTINKWFSYINFKLLSGEAKIAIQKFDSYRKKLTFENTLQLFLFAINDETESLRHLDKQLVNPNMRKTFKLESISYSQLSRALKALDYSVLMEIFTQLLSQVQQKTKGHSKKKIYIVDSTTFSFGKKDYPWAKFRPTKSGIKLHLRICFMGDGLLHPDQFKLSNASEHDYNHLEVFINKAEAIYVFDRGYFEIKRFNELDKEKYYFVTRLKKYVNVNILEEKDVSEESDIISDQIVSIGAKGSRPFRLIVIKRKGRSDLHLITNLKDQTAEEVGNIYKSRWQIELFFKHIKQHMTIKKYFSKSQKGVENQVVLVMIAYLLTLLTKLEMNIKESIFQILRIFRELKFEPTIYFNRYFNSG
jgi:hypothetical protein